MDGEGGTPPSPPINGISEGANVIKEEQLEDFKREIEKGTTIKELQTIFNQSRSGITESKRLYSLVGLSPNSKKLDRDKGTKECISCGLTKDFSEFYSNGVTSTGKIKYKPACTACENLLVKTRFYSLIEDYLSVGDKAYVCEKCGDTDVHGFLHFHHVVPKTKDFEIGQLSKSMSLEVFLERAVPELDKCILLCPSCHVREHLLMG